MKGHCLCGAVSVQTAAKKHVDACHCSMCRRWGGGPALGINCGNDLRIEGESHLRCYKSSGWAERAFCGECGSHIFYHLVEADQYFVPAGLFQDQDGFEFIEQIYIDHKPAYYAFANETEMLTEAEILAKFVDTATPPESG